MTSDISTLAMAHYTMPLSQIGEKKCGICLLPLEEIGIGDTAGKTDHFFHNVCIFKWCEKNAAHIFNGISLEPKIKIPFYYLFPNFYLEYQDIEENQKLIAEQVSRMCAFFLTRQAHEGEALTSLHQLGIDVTDFDPDHTYVSAEKIELFVQNLMKGILCDLSGQRMKACLQTGYSPKKGPISASLEQSEIEFEYYQLCFPFKISIVIKRSNDQIILNVRLASFVALGREKYQWEQFKLQIS
jgi:hypothetical protein